MNNVSRKRPIDEYNRIFTDESDDHLSSEEENNDPMSSDSTEQVQVVTSKSNLFQFHFEFGSKRPPRPSIQEYDSEQEENGIDDNNNTDIDLSDLSNDEEDDYRKGISHIMLSLIILNNFLFFKMLWRIANIFQQQQTKLYKPMKIFEIVFILVQLQEDQWQKKVCLVNVNMILN